MPTRPITVTTSAGRLCDSNQRRTAVSLINNGGTDIFVSDDETNILAAGFPLAAGAAVDVVRALGGKPQDALWGIVAAGTEDMRIWEAFGELPPLTIP